MLSWCSALGSLSDRGFLTYGNMLGVWRWESASKKLGRSKKTMKFCPMSDPRTVMFISVHSIFVSPDDIRWIWNDTINVWLTLIAAISIFHLRLQITPTGEHVLKICRSGIRCGNDASNSGDALASLAPQFFSHWGRAFLLGEKGRTSYSKWSFFSAISIWNTNQLIERQTGYENMFDFMYQCLGIMERRVTTRKNTRFSCMLFTRVVFVFWLSLPRL